MPEDYLPNPVRRQVYAKLMARIDQKLLDQVRHVRPGEIEQSLLSALNDVYYKAGTCSLNRHRLMDLLIDNTLDKHEDLKAYISFVERTWDRLKACGGKGDDSDKVFYLLKHIPDDYGSTIDSSTSSVLPIQTRGVQIRGQVQVRPSGSSPVIRSAPGPVGQKGHWQRACPHYIKAKQEAKSKVLPPNPPGGPSATNKPPGAPPAALAAMQQTEGDEEDEYMHSFMVLRGEQQPNTLEWIVDSGTTDHHAATPEAIRALKNVVRGHQDKVQVANGDYPKFQVRFLPVLGH